MASISTSAILTQDLFFPSKIEGASRAAGVQLVSCSSIERLLQVASGQIDGPVFIDLTCAEAKRGLDSIVRGVREAGFEGTVVAFGPHVQAELLEAAKAAGCDRVLTKGQLQSQLSELF